jgi:hypothetical protein
MFQIPASDHVFVLMDLVLRYQHEHGLHTKSMQFPEWLAHHYGFGITNSIQAEAWVDEMLIFESPAHYYSFLLKYE